MPGGFDTQGGARRAPSQGTGGGNRPTQTGAGRGTPGGPGGVVRSPSTRAQTGGPAPSGQARATRRVPARMNQSRNFRGAGERLGR